MSAGTLSELLTAHAAALSLLQELIAGNVERDGETLLLSADAAHGLSNLLLGMKEDLEEWQQAVPFPLSEYEREMGLDAFLEHHAKFLTSALAKVGAL